MINKCKVQIRMKELYNVVESLKEEDEKMYYLYPENIIFYKTSTLVFLVSAMTLSMHQTD